MLLFFKNMNDNKINRKEKFSAEKNDTDMNMITKELLPPIIA